MDQTQMLISQHKVAEHLRLKFCHSFLEMCQLLRSPPFVEFPGRHSP